MQHDTKRRLTLFIFLGALSACAAEPGAELGDCEPNSVSACQCGDDVGRAVCGDDRTMGPCRCATGTIPSLECSAHSDCAAGWCVTGVCVELEPEADGALYDDFDPEPDPASFGTFGRWPRLHLTWRLASGPSSVGPTRARAAVASALSKWAQNSGLDFTEAPSGQSADITLSMQPAGAHGDACDFAPSTLAHAFFPSPTNPVCTFGQIHFNEQFTWTHDGRDFDYETVALHEIGHALGLMHSTVRGSVMEPFYPGLRRDLHGDDIAGIQSLYGSPLPHPSGCIWDQSGWDQCSWQ